MGEADVMSSRIFQSIIIQMKDATDRCIGVVDDQGVVAACSELSMIGTKTWSGTYCPSAFSTSLNLTMAG